MKKWLTLLTISLVIISIFSRIFEYWPFKTNDLKVIVYAVPFRLPMGIRETKFSYEIIEQDEFLKSLPSLYERKLIPKEHSIFLPASEQKAIVDAFYSGMKEARTFIVVKITNNGNKPVLNIRIKLNTVVYYEMTDSEVITPVYAKFSNLLEPNHIGDSSKIKLAVDPILHGEVVLKSLPQRSSRIFYIWTINKYDYYIDQLKYEFSVVHSEGLSDIEFYTEVPATFLKFINYRWLIALILFFFVGILIVYCYTLRKRLNFKNVDRAQKTIPKK